MDKPGNIPYIHVRGNGIVLDRGEIKRTFSKFGNITKLFVHKDNNYANLYFEDPEAAKQACLQYKDADDYTVIPGIAKKPRNVVQQQNDNDDLNSTTSSTNNLDVGLMDDEVDTRFYSGDFVDINGRPVVFLKSDNGDLYVNLKDVKRVGFNIFPRRLFESGSLSNETILKEVEAKIIHYGMECVLETHRSYTEKEMINLFQRVKDVVFSKKSKPTVDPDQDSRTSILQDSNHHASPSGANSYKRSLFNSHVSFERERSRSKSMNRTSTGGDGDSFRNEYSRNRETPEPRFERSGPKTNGEFRGRTAVRESRPSRDGQSDNHFEQRSRPRSAARPSTTEPPVEPPKQEPKVERISNVSETEITVPLERLTVSKGPVELKVTYLMIEKPIFYAQLIKNLSIAEEILVHVNSEDAILPIVAKPKKDMLVVVEFEELWYRAVVIEELGQPGHVTVELIDYGNKERIKGNIRQMSTAMKKIPAQALRFTVGNQGAITFDKLAIDQELDATVIKQYENHFTTYVVDINRVVGLEEVKPTENVPAPVAVAVKEKCFMEIAKCTAKIVPGELVFIVNHTDDKLIVKNKEMAALTKKITSHISSMEKKPITDAKVGQYVICKSFDFGEGYFRAIIKTINGKVASLELIDFFIEDTLPLTSLMNFDETLASLPPAHIEIDYQALKQVTDEGLELLSSLIVGKIKIKSTNSTGQIDFSYDGKLLSDQIKPKIRPPKTSLTPSRSPVTVTKTEKPAKVEAVAKKNEPVEVKPVVTTKEYVKVNLDNMPFVEPKPGLNDYSCYGCDGNTMTIVDISEENLALVEKITVDELQDNTPYKPDICELCMARFEDTWYRGMVSDELEDGKLEIMFMDYGNITTVAVQDCRRLPEELKTIPILGINVTFAGVKDSDAVRKRLKELITEASILKVNVNVDGMDPESLRYPVEVPEIYKTLKEEGLI